MDRHPRTCPWAVGCALVLAGCVGDRGAEPDGFEDSLEVTTAGTTGVDTTASGSTSGAGGSSSGGPGGSGDMGSTGSVDSTAGDTGSSETTGAGTTTGGEGICGASQGAGGPVGLSEFAAPGYPDLPAMLYVPQGLPPGPAPTMIALHGSGDTAENFVNLWIDVADAEGFVVLVPESSSGGVSWNPGKDTPIIGALYDELAAVHDVDHCRLYLTGYSAGAHVTYMIGLANTKSIAALGVQAGSMSHAEQSGIWPDLAERPVPVTIHHGEADPVVPFSHATAARDVLTTAGHPVDFHPHSGGHEIGAMDPELMWANLAEHRLDD